LLTEESRGEGKDDGMVESDNVRTDDVRNSLLPGEECGEKGWRAAWEPPSP